MRIFAALPLPHPAVEKLEKIARQLGERYPNLKTVKPQGMHVTMLFFGELLHDQVMEIMRAMDSAELKVASIQSVMGGVGQFPPQGPPRVIYCPLNKGVPEITNLYRLFCRRVSGIGSLTVEGENDFVPHITLARNKGSRITLADVEELFQFEYSLILDRLVLYQSILRPQGAEYKAIKTVVLG